jgi:hypothetical protein
MTHKVPGLACWGGRSDWTAELPLWLVSAGPRGCVTVGRPAVGRAGSVKLPISALRETATRQAVASTCGDAFSETVWTVLVGLGRLHFTPRTTPRPRSSDVNEMLPSLDAPMS